MSQYKIAKIKSEALAIAAIEDACVILLQEEGCEDMLKFLAILLRGKNLPAGVIARLRRQVDDMACA